MRNRNKIHIDFETRSHDKLENGSFIYATHPATEILCMSYKIEQGDVKTWIQGINEFPAEVIDVIQEGYIVCAHNAQFECDIFNHVLPKYVDTRGLRLSGKNTDCTMIRALAYGLPGSLEECALSLKLSQQKDKEGKKLMLKMSRPDKNGQYLDDMESIQRLVQYCEDDVRTEFEIDQSIPELSDFDRSIYEVNYDMNNRGVFLDVDLINRYIDIKDICVMNANSNICHLTEGAVEQHTQNTRLVKWLNSRGFSAVKSLSKEAIDNVVALVSDDKVASVVLNDYIQCSQSSLAKLIPMRDSTDKSSRSRGLFNLNRAFTGRWTACGWQPQNLKRCDYDSEGFIINSCAELAENMSNDNELFESMALLDNPYNLISTSMRSLITCPENSMLVGADYSNVEGRVMAFIAGAQEKIKAFNEQDEGGPDLYKLAYASSFGVKDISAITKAQRQIGKTQELALQYQGSASALVAMAKNYGVSPSDISELVLSVASERDKELALWVIEKNPDRSGLSKIDRMGVQILITKWRKSSLNQPIAQFWKDLESSWLEAYKNPGLTVCAGATKMVSYCYDVKRNVMMCRLPTSRILYYHNPGIDDSGIFAMMANSKTGRLSKKNLYGGILSNHVVQGTSAELIKRGMVNIANSKSSYSDLKALTKYDITMTVHDETVAEIATSAILEHGEEAIIDNFSSLMADVGPEFTGLPLICAGWVDKRYIK